MSEPIEEKIMAPDQETARAAVEAGYLSLKGYLEMVDRYGWKPQQGRQ